jgi:hypothetical protein
MGCLTWLIFIAFAIFVMLSFIRWFEQTAEAVDNGWWNKVIVLIAMPFTVWFFPSRVSAGRPTPVPHHEPVRGFGSVPLTSKDVAPAPPDGPPPGTPKEFIGMPVIPAKKPARPPADPEKIAKLKQKMREQGMLGDE